MEQIQQQEVVKWLDYRVSAITSALIVLMQMNEWAETPPSMQIRFDHVLVAQGSAAGYTNPVLEAGILHGRAVLEFIGLRIGSEEDPQQQRATATSRRKVVNVTSRRKDDACIEDMEGLSMPSVADALDKHDGLSAERVERGFAHMLYLANKGLAHMTHGFDPESEGDDIRMLCDAFSAIIALANRHVYTPLGIEPRRFVSVEARQTSACAPHAAA